MANQRIPRKRDASEFNRAVVVGGPLPVAGWAQQILSLAAGGFSEEDLATLARHVRALTGADSFDAPPPPNPTGPTIVRDRASLKKAAAAVENAVEVAISVETNSPDPLAGEIIGIGLLVGDVHYYLPIAHRVSGTANLRPDQLPIDTVARDLGLDRLSLVAHDAKRVLRWVRRHAGVNCRFVWDTMLAGKLLASHLSAALPDLVARDLGAGDWSLLCKEIKNAQFLPVEQLARYAAEKCRAIRALYGRQTACLD